MSFAAWPHNEAIAAILEHAAVACEGSIYDPAHENDLTANWSSAQRAGIIRAFMRLADHARQEPAFEAGGDPDAGLELWHTISAMNSWLLTRAAPRMS